ALGAKIERTARGCKLADGNAHDRRRACLAHLRGACEQRSSVPQPVLAIERDRGKAFAADKLGDDRRGQAAPPAVHGLAGLEPAGEREGACSGHEIIPCCDRPRWRTLLPTSPLCLITGAADWFAITLPAVGPAKAGPHEHRPLEYGSPRSRGRLHH